MKKGFDGAIQDFINFVDRQRGMFIDSLAGFSGNRREIERQIYREQRRVSAAPGADGIPRIMYISVEDPSKPDILIQRIIRVAEYLELNAEAGGNEQQQAQTIMVFIYTFWELETRPKLARIAGCSPDEIKVDIMGDLRRLRHAILHHKGIVSADVFKKLLRLQEIIEPDKPVHFSVDSMKKIFINIHQGLAQLLFEHQGITDAKEKAEDIVGLAIQNPSHVD
jgi:hypothetical protein